MPGGAKIGPHAYRPSPRYRARIAQHLHRALFGDTRVGCAGGPSETVDRHIRDTIVRQKRRGCRGSGKNAPGPDAQQALRDRTMQSEFKTLSASITREGQDAVWQP